MSPARTTPARVTREEALARLRALPPGLAAPDPIPVPRPRRTEFRPAPALTPTPRAAPEPEPPPLRGHVPDGTTPTPDELDVLDLIARNMTTEGIMAELGATEWAVDKAVMIVRSRYGVRCRTAAVAAAIRAGDIDPPRPARGATLTPRQVDVVQRAADGATNEAIAADLGLSQSVVRNHLMRAGRRLGAHTRAGIVAHALGGGLIS